MLPAYHVRERHSIAVDCTPGRAIDSAREVTLAEMPAARALFRLRGLPSAPEGSMWKRLLATGFRVVEEDPGRQVVAAAVGRPWKVGEAPRPVCDFAAFAEPGYAKLALSVRCADGVLSTETRVLLTDRSARRRFALYWLPVRFGSALIRRLWLRAAKRRAERGAPR